MPSGMAAGAATVGTRAIAQIGVRIVPTFTISVEARCKGATFITPALGSAGG